MELSTYPFSNDNDRTAEVWERISNFMPHNWAGDHLSMPGLKLNHANETVPRSPQLDPHKNESSLTHPSGTRAKSLEKIYKYIYSHSIYIFRVILGVYNSMTICKYVGAKPYARL